MGNFQILTVSAIKNCKQRLQTASASEGLRPADPRTGVSPLQPTRHVRPPDFLGYSSRNENYWRHNCLSDWGYFNKTGDMLIINKYR